MRKSRKVCLFVVEGMADKTSLALPLQNLFRHFFNPAYVEFDIMNGDITADYRTKPDTIIRYCKLRGTREDTSKKSSKG